VTTVDIDAPVLQATDQTKAPTHKKQVET